MRFSLIPLHGYRSQQNRNQQFRQAPKDHLPYVDAIELKKPFAECIVNSNCYRDNQVPVRELNGTVMQLEKYLYHLNRWGQQGEETLNKRYPSILPNGLMIKIVNPCGTIIMGKDQGLTPDQRADFEVIRRTYRIRHILDFEMVFKAESPDRSNFAMNDRIRAMGPIGLLP